MPSRPSILRIALGVYLALAFSLTLVPWDVPQEARRAAAHVGVLERPDSVKAATRQADQIERAVNGAMLAPLGVLFVLTRRRPGVLVAIALCGVASASIEVSQRIFTSGRVAEVSDVLLNTAGAGVGASAAGLLTAWRTRAAVQR